jgi:hypothetical protein
MGTWGKLTPMPLKDSDKHSSILAWFPGGHELHCQHFLTNAKLA